MNIKHLQYFYWISFAIAIVAIFSNIGSGSSRSASSFFRSWCCISALEFDWAGSKTTMS